MVFGLRPFLPYHSGIDPFPTALGLGGGQGPRRAVYSFSFFSKRREVFRCGGGGVFGFGSFEALQPGDHLAGDCRAREEWPRLCGGRHGRLWPFQGMGLENRVRPSTVPCVVLSVFVCF